jgi:superfamily II DNA/RNA helicase
VLELFFCNGYPSLFHGVKAQQHRDSTLSDFQRKDGPNVLIATGVVGRGLDNWLALVSSTIRQQITYVHQVGRTSRTGNMGAAYTFVSAIDKANYGPNDK